MTGTVACKWDLDRQQSTVLSLAVTIAVDSDSDNDRERVCVCVYGERTHGQVIAKGAQFAALVHQVKDQLRVLAVLSR